MNFSDQQIEKFVTMISLAVGFLLLIWVCSDSLSFQKACEKRCGDQPALTPVIDFHEQCLCGEGNGRWRREDIGTN
jgi:hypothetical protein